MLNTPEALETLRLLLDARPCVQPSYSNWWRETAKAFAAGDTAMTVLFSNYASEITGLSTKIASDIGTTFVPGGNPLMGGGSIGVCRYSQNKKEALNFIRWFCSEEIASAMTYLGSASPCQATYDNYQIIDLYPWLALTKESMTASHVKRWPQRQGDGFNEYYGIADYACYQWICRAGYSGTEYAKRNGENNIRSEFWQENAPVNF